MDLNFILNYRNNVDRHFLKKKIISIVLYCNYGFLVQHTHTPSPSIVIHFKKHEGVEIRSPRVIRSWSKRERWPVVEQGDSFSIEQPTLNVIHSIHSGVCVERLGATSLIQIRRRWNRCLWWSPALYLSRDLSLSLSFYNFARFHLLLFDRRKKRHERLIDFLNFPPLEWREREREKKSFKVFAKGRKSWLQRFLFPPLSTPPLDDQRDTLPFGWTEMKMQTFIRIQVCIEGQLSTDTLCIKSLVAVLAMGKRIFLNCLLQIHCTFV